MVDDAGLHLSDRLLNNKQANKVRSTQHSEANSLVHLFVKQFCSLLVESGVNNEQYLVFAVTLLLFNCLNWKDFQICASLTDDVTCLVGDIGKVSHRVDSIISWKMSHDLEETTIVLLGFDS